jgi:hypothetical protein
LEELRAFVPRDIVPVHESQPGINNFKAEVELTPIVDREVPASMPTTTTITLLFQNQTEKPLMLRKLDENRRVVETVALAKASRRLVRTQAGFTWIIQDSQEEGLGFIVVPEKAGRVVIQ